MAGRGGGELDDEMTLNGDMFGDQDTRHVVTPMHDRVANQGQGKKKKSTPPNVRRSAAGVAAAVAGLVPLPLLPPIISPLMMLPLLSPRYADGWFSSYHFLPLR